MWVKIKNRGYSQAEGRAEFFEAVKAVPREHLADLDFHVTIPCRRAEKGWL